MPLTYEQKMKKYLQQVTRIIRQRLWGWHPIKDAVYSQNVKKKKNKETGRMVKVHQCNICKNWFQRAKMEIDHIEPIGKVPGSLEDVPAYVERTIVLSLEDLQPLCKPCHKTKTKEDLKKIRGKK